MTKTDKEGLIVLSSLILIFILLIIFFVRLHRTYEYYDGESFGTSKKCYELKGQCYCETENGIIKVHSYYVAK